MTPMRKLMMSSVTVVFLTFAGCTSTQVTTFVTSFLSQVQSTTATACLFVPTIDTILAVAGSLGFAPATAAAAAVTVVANAICSKVPPPASARYGALLRYGAGPAQNVGSLSGVPINGWKTR
jgi:hypothetical protein